MPRVMHIVGTRLNFIKIAPIARALSLLPHIEQQIVHTGQHYDTGMTDVFFRDLELPAPDWSLGVGSGSHGYQTGAVMTRLEPVIEKVQPDLVVVVGDVNSTLAGALVAAKAGIPVAHVEAGLRSFDWSMPEEINRVVTDRLAMLLLTPSRDADRNLLNEGVPADRIHFVGNVMIDSLLRLRSRAPWPAVQRRLGLTDRGFAVLTLHRPANVDDPRRLAELLDRLHVVAARLPIIFPVHPRTAARLRGADLLKRVSNLTIIEPLSYLDFLALMDHSACALTDSGGIQEETTVLGIPCFTLRDNTERPITIDQGTNTLVGADAGALADAFGEFCAGDGKRGRAPDRWDGRAAERIIQVLTGFFEAGGRAA